LTTVASPTRTMRMLRSGGDHGQICLVYALNRGGMPRWLLWAYVAVGFVGFVAMLPISAAFIGTSMATFNRLMIFQNWI